MLRVPFRKRPISFLYTLCEHCPLADRRHTRQVSVQDTAPPARKHATGGKEKAKGFRPDIQGMRTLAVTTVVLYHLWPNTLKGGFVGVDVFFVISGFLITGHLLREYQKTGQISLLQFWGRRAKRLVPAACVVLTVTWIASRYILPATRLADTASQIRASALYYQNWQLAWNAVDYLKSDDAASPVQHFWSLSVEEQFYLGWPVLFLAAALLALTARKRGRQARGQKIVFALAGLVVAGSLVYSIYDTKADPRAAYFVTTTRIWELGVGGLLALMPRRAVQWLGRFGILGWAGLGMVIASAAALSGTMPFPGALALLPVGGAALLILGGSATARFGPARLMSAAPMVFIGGISYSLYLWHWPIIALYTARHDAGPGLAAGLAIIAVSVLLSWLTKVWVEDKVRTARILDGHGWRSASTALVAAVPTALVTLFILGQPAPWQGLLPPNYPGAAALADKTIKFKHEPMLPKVTAITLPKYWQDGCLVAQDDSTLKECVYGDTASPVLTVALVGDSMAGEWFPPLELIAVQRHWKLVVDLHAVCPWTSTMMIEPGATGGPYTACHDWGAAVLHSMLADVRPNVVITSDYPDVATPGHPKVGPPADAEIGAGMVPYWTKLQNRGIAVIGIRESPIVGIAIPECLSRNHGSPVNCAVPTKTAVRKHPPVVVASQAMAGKVPVIDMNSLICAAQTCDPIVGNVLVYQDGHHLTATYAQTLTSYLATKLGKADKILAQN
jgi:peptidoglycan/LPS O-acetylase OafA/YrhL